MEEWMRLAAGFAFAALSSWVGYIMAAHSRLATKQSEDMKAVHAMIDDVKEKYVRRDDFASFREETRDQLQRIEDKTDRIITTLKH